MSFVRSNLLKKVVFERAPDLVIADLPYGEQEDALTHEDGDAHTHMPAKLMFPRGLALSVYVQLVENVLEMGFSPAFVFEVGLVEDQLVNSAFSFTSFRLEVIRRDGFGLATQQRA